MQEDACGGYNQSSIQVPLGITSRISIVIWFVAYLYSQVNHCKSSRQDYNSPSFSSEAMLCLLGVGVYNK